MRILLWNVHGGYTDALLQLRHRLLYLRDPAPDWPAWATGGLGWPTGEQSDHVEEVTVDQLRDAPPDVVVCQRLEEVELLPRLLGGAGRPPMIFLEHNTPTGSVPDTRHPLADRPDWHLVHVTPFNRLFWDSGSTPTTVIEHGVPDPGHRYGGELDRLAFVVNEPVRRWRTTGTDLLPAFAELAVDAFGIDGDLLPAALPQCPRLRFAGNLSSAELVEALAARRAYLHLTRWTSLGLSLITAMTIGMPVLALGTTEAYRAVPGGGGLCSTDVTELATAARRLVRDHELACAWGEAARSFALQRFGIERFVTAWDDCLQRVAR